MTRKQLREEILEILKEDHFDVEAVMLPTNVKVPLQKLYLNLEQVRLNRKQIFHVIDAICAGLEKNSQPGDLVMGFKHGFGSAKSYTVGKIDKQFEK